MSRKDAEFVHRRVSSPSLGTLEDQRVHSIGESFVGSGGSAGALAGAVLDALPDATAVLDTAGVIVAINHAWRMFAVDNGGDPESTGIGVNYLAACDRASADCGDALLAARGIRQVLRGEIVESDLEYPCPSPSADRWFLLRVTRLMGPVQGVVASHINITRRKRIEQVLEHEAAHDPLTGLANRTLFNARLAAALTPRAGRSSKPDVGLLYIDLDRFKEINDTYGHDAGDEVLLVTAKRLRSQCRPQDTVARLGGDEFAIITPRADADLLAALVQRLSRVFDEPILVHGVSLRVRCSIGTRLAGAGDNAADAVSDADQAMYKVKRARPREGIDSASLRRR